MAVLPTLQGRAIPTPTRGIASVTNAGAVGAAVSRLGDGINAVGDVILDREATAKAKERDAEVSDKIRKLMYDPESGFMNLSGEGAVAARERTMAELDALKVSALDGLNNTARRRLEESLTGRIERAMGAIDGHVSTERKVWIEGAADARIASAYQDSLTGDTANALTTIEQEIRGRAVREGWSSEETEQKLGEARSKVYADQVKVLAATDPIGALEYLRENQEGMLPSDIATLEADLIPEAKKASGRMKGAAASMAGVSDEYLANIRSAESGGDDSAKNPLSSATGRYQFIKSTWDELVARYPDAGLTSDGRLDAAQQEIAIRLFTAENAKRLEAAGITPTNGNLYAAHFLGAGGAIAALSASPDTAMSDVVAPGVISANGFLSGMTVGDFQAWAARKGGGSDLGFSENAAGMGAILEIEDPVERAAAMDEYTLRMSVKAGEQKAALDAAKSEAFSWVVDGNSVDTIPLEYQKTIGIEAMTSLRSYERSMASGTPIKTDPEAYLELSQMQARDPDGFRSANLLTYVDKLSESDWKKFADAQNADPADTEARGMAASTLMEAASRQMRAAGVDVSPEAGSDDAKAVAAMQTRLLKWQEDMLAGGKKPTPADIDAQVLRELTPIVIDDGWFGKPTVKASRFEVQFDGGTLDDASDDLTPADLRDGALKIGSTEVTNEDIDRAARDFNALNGRAPTVEEMIDYLIGTGYYR